MNHHFCLASKNQQFTIKIIPMGYPTKVQLIKRAKSEQWYINFPSALAQAIEFKRGEIVEWIIDDHQRLILRRGENNLAEIKIKLTKKHTQEVL